MVNIAQTVKLEHTHGTTDVCFPPHTHTLDPNTQEHDLVQSKSVCGSK